MPVVATAGHVDHGKSALVEALTGRDPDRWAEEKRRGLTIDLGFAWTTLPTGADVGFVDVPGHERFIKNMLAGVEAVDAVLFVVAADEGWMPQSEEHLAVIDCLGIGSGVVALTRADLVDEETLTSVALEVEERLAGTILEDAPLIPTAAPSGRGIAELVSALGAAVAAEADTDEAGARLWIDRSFTIAGAGTVVTGTLTGGPLQIGDSLTLWPREIDVRVRGLQSHERPVERILPTSRTAVNLAGIDRAQVTRGDMLGRPGRWRATDRLLARLEMVRSLTEALRDRGAFHLHIGSGSQPARVRLLEGSSLAGAGAALVTTATPLPLRCGDRFILRDVGRRSVVAGGIVLDPRPALGRRAVRASLARLGDPHDPHAAATGLLRVRGRELLSVLGADSGGGRPAGAQIVADVAIDAGEARQLLSRAAALVSDFHGEYPLRPGMPKADLAGRIGIDAPLLEGLLAAAPNLLAAADLVDDGATVRVSSFAAGLDAAAAAAWDRVRRILTEAGAAPPRRRDLDLDDEVLHALVRSGRLTQISPELVYLPETLDAVVAAVRELPDGFTVAGFRDALGITRRHAVPLLEWLDAEGVTRREGDGRTVRRSPPDGPEPGGVRSR